MLTNGFCDLLSATRNAATQLSIPSRIVKLNQEFSDGKIWPQSRRHFSTPLVVRSNGLSVIRKETPRGKMTKLFFQETCWYAIVSPFTVSSSAPAPSYRISLMNHKLLPLQIGRDLRHLPLQIYQCRQENVD